MLELIERRQENSKRFKLDARREQLRISMGAVHYKDDYASDEQWKDIDLTWEGNRITKAPYELTLEGKKITLKNKKTGEVSAIELMEIGGKIVLPIPDIAFEKSVGLTRIPNVALDTDLEIKAEFSAVRFRRVLKSNKAPLEAKFKVTGNFGVRAGDADGELPVETTVKDGILTETLKPDRLVKYPVRIDPTYQVGASSDDCWRYLGLDGIELTTVIDAAGCQSSTNFQTGSGMRFTGVAVDQGATIDNGTYLIFRAQVSLSATVVNTRISAEDVDDAITFANDKAAFDTRWAARTTARVDWDAIAGWTAETDYNSPEIKTVIQEIVDRGGWASGQDIVIFWEDYDDRSTHGTNVQRQAHSYDGDTTYCPQLVITVAVAVSAKRGWWSK